MTIDLSAERNLMEAMTLSFMLPFALGWFWFAHAIARRQRLWVTARRLNGQAPIATADNLEDVAMRLEGAGQALLRTSRR